MLLWTAVALSGIVAAVLALPILPARHADPVVAMNADVGETTNVADEHPEVVARLKAAAEAARADLGDSLTGAKGKNVRPAGVRGERGRTPQAGS